MKFRTKKFALQALLDKAMGVVPSKESVPILKNFRMEADAEGQLRVAATDLQLSVVAATSMVTVEESGSALFPALKLSQIVREAEDGELVLSVEDRVATIEVGRAQWTLSLQDEEEYPELSDTSKSELSEIDRAKFLAALKSVRHAAATEASRLNMMVIDIRNGKMRASDGVRFQQSDIEGFPLEIMIPILAVDDLVRALQSTEAAQIGVGELENHLIFRIGGDHFIARKLNVEFPNMEEQLLKPVLANNQELHVSRSELIQAVKQVRITADPQTSAVRLHLQPPKDAGAKMIVSSKDKYGSGATAELDVSWNGPDRQITVNHHHLLEMLAMTSAKSCSFFLGPDMKKRPSPILLKDTEGGSLGVLSQTRGDFVSD